MKYFTNCEMHYINSNPNGMADAGIKPTSKVCKNCTVFGNYDEMIPFLIVTIIDHPKEKLDYNMYPVYTMQTHFGVITSPESGNANFL